MSGVLSITVNSGEALKDKSLLRAMDPYVIVKFGKGKQLRTRSRKEGTESTSPTWEETFQIKLSEKEAAAGGKPEFSVYAGLGAERNARKAFNIFAMAFNFLREQEQKDAAQAAAEAGQAADQVDTTMPDVEVDDVKDKVDDKLVGKADTDLTSLLKASTTKTETLQLISKSGKQAGSLKVTFKWELDEEPAAAAAVPAAAPAVQAAA